MFLANFAELSIIHNHCAIELAIDNALYALNVKMVFGNTPCLHHLRHRSHEPQVNESWEGDPQRKPMLSQTSTTNTSHPSISMEITPLDVETPTTTQGSYTRLFPAILANHRSTPTTPAEETRYRKRLLDSGPVSGGLPSDWKGMMFTLLDSDADLSEDPIDVVLPSPNYQHQSPASAMLGDGITDEGNRLSLTITPPSTPSFSTPSLGSPALTYSTRGIVKDASGTRRMMLKRKSSSFLRASASQPVNENGSRGHAK